VAKDGNATKFTKQRQITEVMRMLTRGYSRVDILEESEKLWGLKRSATDDLIRAARKEFVEQYQHLDRKELVAESIDRFQFLYREGVKKNQLAVSIAAQQALNKMIGIDSTKGA
jgi:hypothetical protein